MAVLTCFPLAMLGIYCAELPVGGLMAFGAAAMVSAACFIGGSLLGFLFGIPRALSSDARIGLGEQDSRLIANTNLEQVSDWLTKVIVGATLVQLGSLTRRFGELTVSVSSIFGSPSMQNRIVAGAIIFYSAAFGFFSGYIAARSIITGIFYISPSDWFGAQQRTRAKQDTGGAERPQAERSGLSGSMAEKKALVVYAAAYETVGAALADLGSIAQLHKDGMTGQYDAAVINKENGIPHIVKRMDRPHIHVIPEWFGGGTLPRKELREAAEQLTANQAGLIAIGEPTIEKGLDKALTGAAKVVKRTVEATTDELTSELQEALKG
jgi:hypothetical protein